MDKFLKVFLTSREITKSYAKKDPYKVGVLEKTLFISNDYTWRITTTACNSTNHKDTK